MSVRVTVHPAVEPVSIADAKEHLRFDSAEMDQYLAGLITACRRKVEEWEWRAHVTQTLELALDRFPSRDDGLIWMPRPPLQSPLVSIAYVDGDGVTQTLAASLYDVDTAAEPGRVGPSYGNCWPATRDQRRAVIVTYKAGYGDGADNVPAETRHAIKLLLGHLFRTPSAVTDLRLEEAPLAVQALLRTCWDARVLPFVNP